MPVVSMILFCFVFVSLCTSLAAANTEIKNFQVGLTRNVPQHAKSHSLKSAVDRRLGRSTGIGWHALNATQNELSFRVQPAPLGTPLQAVCEQDIVAGEDRVSLTRSCPHELWLELDLSAAEWMNYDKFTIRLSWPAFYPTDFDIDVFSPEEMNRSVQKRPEDEKTSKDETSPFLDSRMRYARIRLVDTGIRPPSKPGSTTYQSELQKVPFMVIVEPLLFSVLPASLVTTILFLIPLLLGVALAYPSVMQYLESVAAEAGKEMYGSEKAKVE